MASAPGCEYRACMPCDACPVIASVIVTGTPASSSLLMNVARRLW